MTNPRLSLALGEGGLRLSGTVAVIGPRAEYDLAPLEEMLSGRDGITVVQRFSPDHDYFARMGLRTLPELPAEEAGRFDAVLFCLPRAKALARAELAEAAAAVRPGGTVIVDGLKTDGVDSFLKDIRRRAEVTGPWSKAHGKIFAFPATDAFAEWREAGDRQTLPGGWVTAPGVFSADGVDPASEALAAALPAKLGGEVADLGAGWGYLSARALEGRDGIRRLHLVEADKAALDCARENLRDRGAEGRVEFHWADATSWGTGGSLDAVIMNPPFHTSRAADPGIGRAFIATAARLVKPSGHLWMVANRHLPYEAALAQSFAKVTEAGGDARFKIFHAERPARPRR
ncbi:methyltransferase [Aquicoccus sp. SCR17]|nr:methyltransferase [Carideicomes alvinocaridis]